MKVYIWKGDTSTKIGRPQELKARAQENPEEVAVEILHWKGSMTSDYLVDQFGIDPWKAEEILEKIVTENADFESKVV